MATHANALPDKNLKMPGLSKQYLLIKNKYPEFIVLFQVGDFYEIYGDDAVKVADKTSLRISRNPNVNKLMAGFPVRSLDSWLMTLVQQGFQLAICPQCPGKWVFITNKLMFSVCFNKLHVKLCEVHIQPSGCIYTIDNSHRRSLIWKTI